MQTPLKAMKAFDAQVRITKALALLALVESLPGSTGMHGECIKHRDCLAYTLREVLRGDAQ